MKKSHLGIVFGLLVITASASAIAWPASPAGESENGRLGSLLHPDLENGRIGIGTTSPERMLHIYDTQGAVMRLENNGIGNAVLQIKTHQTFSDPDSFGQAAINFLDASGSARGQIGYYPNEVSGEEHMTFNTGGTERIRIKENGNVGIGTTSPVADLDVDGTVKALNFDLSTVPNGGSYGISSQDGLTRWLIRTTFPEDTSNTGSDLTIQAKNDDGTPLLSAMTIKRSNGNVGIGTITPSAKFQINGTKKYEYQNERELTAQTPLCPEDVDELLFDVSKTIPSLDIGEICWDRAYYKQIFWYKYQVVDVSDQAGFSVLDNNLVKADTLLLGTGLRVGDVADGYPAAQFNIHGHVISMKGMKNHTALPYIQWSDENNERAMYLGWGNKNAKFINMALENDYDLFIGGGNVGIETSTPRGMLDVASNLVVTRQDRLILNDDETIDAPIYTALTGLGISYANTNGANPTCIWQEDDTDGIPTTGIITYIHDSDGGDDCAVSSDLKITDYGYYDKDNSTSFEVVNDELFRDLDDDGNYDAVGGNVGVGTTSPSAKLEVAGSTNSSIMMGSWIDTPYLRLQQQNVPGDTSQLLFTTKDHGSYVISSGDSTDYKLRFMDGLAGATRDERTRMIIDSTGNVGIGTNIPGSKLSVVGLPSGTTDSVATGNLAGAVCITDTGNMYIDTDGSCAN